ncbi:MAG TPA: flavodoxin domain-containing protein [Mobilitalea sp.]|nr:flavodoxin domain-containing protein [Mobilitalea sp.]
MSNLLKTVVVYRSRSGYTKKYAQWIAEDLGCALLEGGKVNVENLSTYDTIIYGAGLYASGINGINLIKKNYDLLKEKHLIVFVVGASPVREETTARIRKSNLLGYEKISFYCLRGGYNGSKLSPFLRFLMKIKICQLKLIRKPNSDAKAMLTGYKNAVDYTNKKDIEPILLEVMAKTQI